MSKVPQIIVLFWVIKVLTTAQGEAVSDFAALRYGPVIVVSLGAVGLAIALTFQFRARQYMAWIYRAAVVMVAVFGTMAADGLHVELGVRYDVSTPFFAVSLAVIFTVWYATEKTLSIHSINTPRREFFSSAIWRSPARTLRNPLRRGHRKDAASTGNRPESAPGRLPRTAGGPVGRLGHIIVRCGHPVS